MQAGGGAVHPAWRVWRSGHATRCWRGPNRHRGGACAAVRGSDGGAGGIEIVLPNGARVSVDAFVNEKALSRVLRAMKGAT